MHILIDGQPLQTAGAADRGVGRYTNGLLEALAQNHQVVLLHRPGPFLVPLAVGTPRALIHAGMTPDDFAALAERFQADVIVNCGGPSWEENVIVPGLRRAGVTGGAPLVASVFYDAIPWIFPEHYLPGARQRCTYHNRCVDLYVRADLVLAISQSSADDVVRFGYATADKVAVISTGVSRLRADQRPARSMFGLPKPYLLNVSGDDYRKNPEGLIAAFLRSRIRESHCLVAVISNDGEGGTGGFSRRMAARFGRLRPQGVFLLPRVSEGQLGALYRDADAFLYTSLYEGFGMPLVEAMQAGKWLITPTGSSLGEVAGPVVLSAIRDPNNREYIVAALDEAREKLRHGPPPAAPAVARAEAFTWPAVAGHFERAVQDRQQHRRPPDAVRPRLFWASPYPQDPSGISYYAQDLLGPVAKQFEIVLVPNTVATFVPTPQTGRFKIAAPSLPDLFAANDNEQPSVFYHVGNSHFHMNLVDLLLALPGVVSIHDSYLRGLYEVWRDRLVDIRRRNLEQLLHVNARWSSRLAKLDRLLTPNQPSLLRRIVRRFARLPGISAMVKAVARRARQRVRHKLALLGFSAEPPKAPETPFERQVIGHSDGLLFLCDHARSLLKPEYLRGKPSAIVPLYCRYRGAVGAEEKRRLRQRFGIPEGAFVVATAGIQVEMKLTDKIVYHCMELQRRRPGARVYLQILGRFDDRKLHARVKGILEGGGIEYCLADDFLDEALFYQRLALSDVVVFLRGWSTGGPSAGLNDALGMGIPGVITDDFALKEYPDTSVLKLANEKVADGLVELFDKPDLRRALAAGGLDYARANSLDAVGGMIAETLRRHGQRASAAAAGNGSAPRPAPEVFVDLTFHFHHKARSGLQRVEQELALGLHEWGKGGRPFQLVVWNQGTGHYHRLPVEALRGRDQAPPLADCVCRWPVVTVRGGAHLFVLASNWPLGQPYFDRLLALKAQGVHLGALVPDLIPIRHRHTFYRHHSPGTTIDAFAGFCHQVVPACAHVFTISNHVLGQLHDFLWRNGRIGQSDQRPPRWHVLQLGADFKKSFVDGAAGPAVRASEALPRGPFVLYVATLELRKNHQRLFDALCRVRRQKRDLELVLVGGVDGGFPAAQRKFIDKNGWVHHYRRIDDAGLERLYERCLFTVYPSLDEGYGLPVVESLRRGKLCLAARAGAIPEAGGPYADYFDPLDAAALAARILHYATDAEALRERQEMLHTYRPISWKTTVQQIADAYGVEADAVVRSEPLRFSQAG
jgi:glycosyltransferase involved in cell wall biosynthesis